MRDDEEFDFDGVMGGIKPLLQGFLGRNLLRRCASAQPDKDDDFDFILAHNRRGEQQTQQDKTAYEPNTFVFHVTLS
jgi:hypothetical protein